MERGVRLVSATVLSRILTAVLFTENVSSEIKPLQSDIRYSEVLFGINFLLFVYRIRFVYIRDNKYIIIVDTKY